jgi:nitric oxide reductase large subunit
MAAPLKKEPNKYAKNADIKADTLSKTIVSTASFALMIIGIIGIAKEFFKGSGFIPTALSWLFDSTSHMMFIPVIILVLWLLNKLMSTPHKNESKKAGNIPMYAMMAVGAFYLFRLISTGGF